MKRNNEHNEFVGNFDNFFDNESSLTGGLDFDSPISVPVVIPTPPRNPRNIAVSAAGPKIQSLSPAIAFVLENTPKYRCKITPPYYVRDDINGTVLDYTKCPKKGVSVGVSTGPQTPPSSGSGGTTSGGTSVGGDGTISETVSTGSNQSETATEQKPSSGEVKKTEKESDCKIDYMKFLAFMFMGFILFYFLAKHYKKDKIYMSITGVIIGIIGYYLFYKNKCK